MPSSETEITQPFGWLCHMTIVRLPEAIGGCLIYSPVLGQNQTIQPIVAELTERYWYFAKLCNQIPSLSLSRWTIVSKFETSKHPTYLYFQQGKGPPSRQA